MKTSAFKKLKTFPEWKILLGSSIVTPEQLASCFPVSKEEIRQVTVRYPMLINPYYLSLIRKTGDPMWKQAVPDIAEIQDHHNIEDPLFEEDQSPVPNLIHRYPDRVILLVSAACAMFCRHCMRKRKVGKPFVVTDKTIDQGIEYIKITPGIREVILSGGDPFLLDDENLQTILQEIHSISHIEVIRIHTRVPCTLPQRVTLRLTQMLRQFHPLYINTQFNHPDEITPESAAACNLLADAGIPLGCQTVLLKGVNDTPETMKLLMQKLLAIRVRPYYIHQADLVQGTKHFHTDLKTGLKIMESLRGHISGMGVPQYMIDLPGGCGKIPLLPEYIVNKTPDLWKIKTFDGKVVDYPVSVNKAK